MKKLFGVVAIAAGLALGGVDNASAVEAGPFMITFTGFCDCITIYHDALGTPPISRFIYGTWDWFCAGAPPYTPITGIKDEDGFSFGGSPPPIEGEESAFTATFDFGAGGVVDLYATGKGRTGDAFQFEDNVPYAIAAGSCPGAPANGNPPLLANRW